MNIGQLECFVSLASTLNFMQTANELGLTQPAVSKQIKSMEEELGAPLFLRTSRSVSLTQIGTQFLPEATDMLNIFYRSKEWISSYNTEQRNALKIGYSDPLQLNLISPILKNVVNEDQFRRLIPELLCDQTDANLSRLQKGQLDVVIGMKDAQFDDGNIIFKKLADNGFRCVVSKQHPLIDELSSGHVLPEEVSTTDLWSHRQILNIPPYLLKSYYSRGYRILPVNDQLDNIVCSSANEAISLARAGLGYTMVPEHMLTPDPDLVIFRWKETKYAPFGIYFRKETSKSSVTYEFVKKADSFIKGR
ncbi:MAG: LysR family transcriptional regulator [Lachnospiraceae bacterium]|nr:LysR family transcriptional regulator [Lachnospiraceae bacterium]